MASKRRYLAVDVGASSGRAVVGAYDGERVRIDEVHRFDSGPVRIPSGLYVDDLGIHRGIVDGLSAAGRQGEPFASVGIDTWGVTVALVDRAGAPCGHPVHYRDGRSQQVISDVYRRMPPAELYAATGIQELPFNTSFMLSALARQPQFGAADRLLMLPDLFASWLSGVEAVERTNASTTQLYDSLEGDWCWPVIDRLDLPRRLFSAPLIDPGQRLGPLRPDVAADTGLDVATEVVAVASHDTASAVVATPGIGDGWAYLSSGTWSLLGVEAAAPVRTAMALAANLTNEAGVGGVTRLLRNVMGLWLVQESRRAWARQGDASSFADLEAAAAAAAPFGPVIDPDDPSLFAPGDLPLRIRERCRADGQPVPTGVGEVVRCALESLALKYRWTVQRLEAATGRRISTVHVVGGGARNRLLCQLTADACGVPVLAGPVEATAVGNVLVQAIADGELADVAEARDLVRRTFDSTLYEPSVDRDRWAGAAAAFDARLAVRRADVG